MSLLKNAGVASVRHFAPLHYLPFIGRSRTLKCKPALAADGFDFRHLRSKSARQDVLRGFGEYAFLTLDPTARIACAKLDAGFPHICIEVPPDAVDATEYSLCRFNVAMTRYLRRGDKPGPSESDSNGRYYGEQQIPTARTPEDKVALLAEHLNRGTMIEVLIHGNLPLPDDTRVLCYRSSDASIARSALQAVNAPWPVLTVEAPGPYNRRQDYVAAVTDFISTAIANPDWRGNGLEFDKV